MTGMLTV